MCGLKKEAERERERETNIRGPRSRDSSFNSRLPIPPTCAQAAAAAKRSPRRACVGRFLAGRRHTSSPRALSSALLCVYVRTHERVVLLSKLIHGTEPLPSLCGRELFERRWRLSLSSCGARSEYLFRVTDDCLDFL